MSNRISLPGRLALLCASLLLLWGSFHLWAKWAPPLESAYLVDYLRLQADSELIPQNWWGYTVIRRADGKLATIQDGGDLFSQKEPLSDRKKFLGFLEAKVYEQKTLWQLFLLPGSAWLLLTLLLFFAAGKMNRPQAQEGDLIRGPKLISHFRWNLRTLFQKKGLYIPTE